MNERAKWQDWGNLILGIWLFLSPFFLGYAGGNAAAWNSYILGVGISVFAVAALARRQPWEEWTNLVLGVWVVIAPWVLGFWEAGGATWNHVIVGLLVAMDAGWAARDVQRQQHA